MASSGGSRIAPDKERAQKDRASKRNLELVAMQVRLPELLHARIRRLAASRDVAMNALIVEVLEGYVSPRLWSIEEP
jgi:predicted HicB family RNase H-like nuclease